jgi:DNA-directed RNA polymerase specialized sigma24 family protein
MPANVLDLAEDQDPESILALDDAMTRLMGVDANAAMVVRLRFFAGRTVDETAAALGLSPRQVDREWAFARAWLSEALGDADAPSDGAAGSGPPKPARPSK